MQSSRRFCRCLNVEIQVRTAPSRRRASSQTRSAIDIPDVSPETWQTLVSWLNFDESVDATLFESCVIDSISIKYRWLVSSKNVGTCQLFRCWCCQSDLFLSSSEIIGPAMMSLGLQTEDETELHKPKMKANNQYSDFFDLILPAAASPQPDSPMVGHPLSSLVEDIREKEEEAMRERVDEFIRNEETAFTKKCELLEEENEIIRHASIACYRNHFGYNHPLLLWNPPSHWNTHVEPLDLSQVDLSDGTLSTSTSLRTDTTEEAFSPSLGNKTRVDVIKSTQHALCIQTTDEAGRQSLLKESSAGASPVSTNPELGKEFSYSPVSTSSQTGFYSPISAATRSSQVRSSVGEDFNRSFPGNTLLPPTHETVLDMMAADYEDEADEGDLFTLDEDLADVDKMIDPSSMTPWEAHPSLLFYGVNSNDEKQNDLPTIVEVNVTLNELHTQLNSERGRADGVLSPRSRVNRKPQTKLPKVMRLMQGQSMPMRMGASARLLSREKHTPSSRDRFSPGFLEPHTIVDSAPARELGYSVPTRFKSKV